jgi:hypothetical protein
MAAGGPVPSSEDATVAEMDAGGNLVVLRQGTNGWVCFPGDENEIGNVPMRLQNRTSRRG